MGYTIFQTAWGSFGLVAERRRLHATYLPDSVARIRRAIRESWPEAVEHPDAMPGLRRQVIDYFNGKPTAFRAPIEISNLTPFRQAVLEACRRVPFGRTASYSDLARAAGQPAAARAVGSAMAHNPFPLIVPCHRVLRSDKTIGGFSAPRGVEQKKKLLALEGTLELTRF